MGSIPNGESGENFHTCGDGFPTPPNQNPPHLFASRERFEGHGISPVSTPRRAKGDLYFGRNAFRQHPRGLFDRFPRRTVDRRQELRNVCGDVLRVVEQLDLCNIRKRDMRMGIVINSEEVA